jgi:hypothetical protein
VAELLRCQTCITGDRAHGDEAGALQRQFERFHPFHACLLGHHLKSESDGLTDVCQGLIAVLPLRMAPGQIQAAAAAMPSNSLATTPPGSPAPAASESPLVEEQDPLALVAFVGGKPQAHEGFRGGVGAAILLALLAYEQLSPTTPRISYLGRAGLNDIPTAEGCCGAPR